MPGDYIDGYILEGLRVVDGALNVSEECIAALNVPVEIHAVQGSGILQQVAQPHRPAVGEFRRVDKLVDDGVALTRSGVGEERADIVGGGNPAGQIEIDAAQKLRVGGEPGRGNLLLDELA